MAIEKRIGAYSAYAIAVENGFQGTVDEWLESLIGPRGYQGWGVSAVSVSADGSLIFTIKNPETGETRELEPIQIETLNALDSISTAKDEAVNEVKETQTQATEAVDTAKTQALQDISDAKTSATGAVNAAGTQAVDAVNTAGTQAASDAQTAITAAKNQAVSGIESAGQSAVEAVQGAQTAGVQAVETAQTNAVQAVENAGTAEVEKINDILPVPTEADTGKVPVVKPDGSGYELVKDLYETVEIANVTVSESVEKLVIEMNAFDYRKVLVKVYAPGNNQSAQLLLNALVNKGHSARYLIRVPEGAIDSSPRTTTIIWDVIPPIGINKNTQPLYAGVALTSISAMNLAEVYQTDMTELQISSVLGDAIIPSGTIVTVIGVR